MPYAIDPAHDALLVVDVQNDFCPGGSLAVTGGDAVVPLLNRCARAFATRRAPVFASRDWHPAKTKHFQAWGGPWPPHCVQGTPGAEFHTDLVLPPGTEVISKGMNPEEDAYSAFQAETSDGTRLAAALEKLGIRRLFVGGLATDYCVRSSVLDARQRGIEVVVLEDAVRAVNVQPGDGERALREMRDAGARLAAVSDLG